MKRFEIRDWANNICFDGKTFDTFEDAWEFIYETDPQPEENSPEYDEHWFDDYSVEEVRE